MKFVNIITPLEERESDVLTGGKGEKEKKKERMRKKNILKTRVRSENHRRAGIE